MGMMPETHRFADESLRRALTNMVRGRVPPHEVDEIVQETLADACAAKTAPHDADSLERWVRGIARHKVADYHRRAKREVVVEPDTLASARVTDHDAHDAADLLRWAEKESNDKTLDWLLREGDGEKLQTIAEEEKVPAARIRKRVERLRRHFRARWAAQIAAAFALGALIMFALRPRPEPIAPVVMLPTPAPSPAATAPNPGIEVRKLALELCGRGEWRACIDSLDRAAQLDPAGDSAPEVKNARDAATEALKPKVVTAPSPKPVNKNKAAPPKKATTDIDNAYLNNGF
jgi:DNA-directed RNA polymerase specialized sigma24 family protein